MVKGGGVNGRGRREGAGANREMKRANEYEQVGGL